MHKYLIVPFLLILSSVFAGTVTENFDSDPGWTSVNLPSAENNFGFSLTSNAGGGVGEVGGVFSRTSNPSHFADTDIGSLAAESVISASGRFDITSIGTFNSGIELSHFELAGSAAVGIGFAENSSNSLRVFSVVNGGFHSNFAVVSGLNVDRTWAYQYNVSTGILDVQLSGSGGGNFSINVGSINVASLDAFGVSHRAFGCCSGNVSLFFDDITYTSNADPIPLNDPVPEPTSFTLMGLVFAMGLFRVIFYPRKP